MKNNLEEIINERGIKISWIAEKTGLHRNTIINAMNGTTAPRLDVAFKICKALNLTIYDIWDPNE